MTELSLHVLDIVQNSIRANATQIDIGVMVNTKADTLCITIHDNGDGMTKEQLAAVTDPFFTTRTTRKVGMGVSLFQMAAEMTGGDFHIDSALGRGTRVRANFILSHIDRIPLGDMGATIHALVTLNPTLDFTYAYQVDGRAFALDTKEFREILQGVSFTESEVSRYIRDYLSENTAEVNGDTQI